MIPELTADMLAQLRTTGLTSRAVAERLAVGVRTASALLLGSGATQSSGLWRFPSLERNRKGWAIMEQPACSTGRWKR